MFINIINHNRDMKKVIFLIIYSLVLSITIVIGYLIVAPNRMGYDKSLISCDDRSIVKDLKDKFCVSYVTENYMFSKNHFLLIAFREEETYGYVIYYPDIIYFEKDKDIIYPKIEWLDDGIKITSEAGVEMFLKKELYSKLR